MDKHERHPLPHVRAGEVLYYYVDQGLVIFTDSDLILPNRSDLPETDRLSPYAPSLRLLGSLILLCRSELADPHSVRHYTPVPYATTYYWEDQHSQILADSDPTPTTGKTSTHRSPQTQTMYYLRLVMHSKVVYIVCMETTCLQGRELLSVPERGTVVVSMSGGKDSTALACALLARVEKSRLRFVFADTQWEAPETYAYIESIERTLGINIERATGLGFENLAIKKGTFPSRVRRFCTEELKLKPIRAWLDAQEFDGDFCMAVGVRAAESESRSKMPPSEWSEAMDCLLIRPLLRWSLEDVIEEMRRSGMEMNPLYERGYDRVGCYPCILSTKKELHRISEDHPEVFDRIVRLEDMVDRARKERNLEKPGRYKDIRPTMFVDFKKNPVPAEGLLDFVKSNHYKDKPAKREGCMKWGLCDLPDSDE